MWDPRQRKHPPSITPSMVGQDRGRHTPHLTLTEDKRGWCRPTSRWNHPGEPHVGVLASLPATSLAEPRRGCHPTDASSDHHDVSTLDARPRCRFHPRRPFQSTRRRRRRCPCCRTRKPRACAISQAHRRRYGFGETRRHDVKRERRWTTLSSLSKNPLDHTTADSLSVHAEISQTGAQPFFGSPLTVSCQKTLETDRSNFLHVPIG